jgi:hypothetical protein
MNHWSGQPVPYGVDSQVFLSREPEGKLLVFVHGYTGKAVKTWEEFDSLIPQDDFFKGYDVLFYGYPGFRSNVIAGAALLCEMLEAIYGNPEMLIQNPRIANSRPKLARYDQIGLVGHSLGSLLIRWALVIASKEKGMGWKKADPRFVLFAPAHSGNLLETALEELRSSWAFGSMAGAVLGISSPFLNELAPGSAVLLGLQEAVKQEGNSSLNFFAHKVVIAELDQVVSNLPFPGDPMPIAIRGKGHIDVCKPKAKTYERPLEILKEVLR